MKKSKKQVSDLETIESYFTSGNTHTDKYYFKIYKAAEREQIFESLLTPLWIINKLSSDCYAGRKKPVQTVKQVKGFIESEGLNYEQKCFVYDHLIKLIEDSTWTDENGKEVHLDQIKELLDNEFESLAPEKAKPVYEPAFVWEKTKKYLETLPDTKAKIRYLTEIKTDYQQNHGFEMDWGTPFDKQCELEIKKLKALAELESTPAQTKAVSKFTLSKALSKIDYIRIINALYELRCFQNKDETYPNKIDVMTAFGNLINIDLSDFSNNINKAFNSNVSIEQNIEIFDKLQKKTKDLYLNNQNKPKK
jgi:hypothetical protein